jgi:hypothetical protein
MVWDAALHEIVLFGGATTINDSGAFGQTWLFYDDGQGQGFNWHKCDPCGTISALISPGLAYDKPDGSFGPTDGQVIEYGGKNGSNFSSTTYAFTGTWAQAATTGPIGLASPAMAYHDARQRVILYGGKCDSGVTGCNSNGFYGATWSWDGSSWTQLSGTGPGDRSGHRMEFDPALATASIVMFGGYCGTGCGGLLNDTWKLPSIGNWSQCLPGTICANPPAARCCVGLAYDARNSILVLFGGSDSEDADAQTFYSDTWTFNGTGWHCLLGC